jgi:glycosyltransferase involved in cell wall biosynthesis
MIYFDVTKSGGSGHHSGLMRVSARLRAALGETATAVAWAGDGWRIAPGGTRIEPGETDWLLTAELFSESERPGFTAWLNARRCRWAAIFHDAIPLRLPQITWPQSVARHPGYMKLLAQCDRVWAVSQTSREELTRYWQWLGLEVLPPVDVLALGADFNGQARGLSGIGSDPLLLCVGILEPRKNQLFLLGVAEALWREGLKFELHLVGRVNPHFGRPIEQHLQALRQNNPGLHFHAAADDATLAGLFARARATVFPTRAEGCGLPLIESLWRGVPCVASDLPVLRENAAGGGCVLLPLDDHAAWVAGLRRVLSDAGYRAGLAAVAATRELPTWAVAAKQLRAGLGG